MVIKEDSMRLIVEAKLNKAELKAFKIFLLHERDRHIDDITKIDETLRKL